MERLTAWLLTYLLHSSLLLGAAALARLVLRERRLALQEALLRAALVGGFVTAGLQVGFGLASLGGELAVRAERAGVSSAAIAAVAPAAQVDLSLAAAPEFQGPPTRSHATPQPVPVWSPRLVTRWQDALGLAWGLVALLGLARLAVAALRLRRLLRGRRPLADARLREHVELLAHALRLRRRVPVTTAPRLSVPLATGVWRPEVCLPARVLAELPGEDQAALCAHELAHVARRDPAWILAARVIATLAPLQPLNHWARRRLRDLAECLSDDLAVSASARPLGLARSLVDVASWTLPAPSFAPLAAAGALSPGSRLGHRVERLMDPVRILERPRRLFLPLAVAGVLATALVMPAISGGQAPPPRPAAPAVAPDAPEPPDPPEPPDAVEPPDAPEPPEAPEAPPAPTAAAPVATAAPVVAPAPVAPAAPRAPAPPAEPRHGAEHGDAHRALERLTARIEERMRTHAHAMAAIEAQAEALASLHHPELEHLGQQVAQAAGELAELSVAGREPGDEAEGRAEKRAQARRRIDEARRQMQSAVAQMRLHQPEMRQLQEQARALAEAARPTDEERREIERLSAHIAREVLPQVEEIRRQAHEAAQQARGEMLRAAEELKRAAAEMRRAAEEVRRAREHDPR